MHNSRGFTLVELIIAMVLMGIIVAVLAPLAAHPFTAYQSGKERAMLVALADDDFFLMLRDVHQALPNSLRVNAAGTAFEMIHVENAGRYRAVASNLAGSDTLDFTQPDNSFQVAGSLPNPTAGTQLVIYHTGQPGADAYAGDAVVTPTNTGITSIPGVPESLVKLSSAHQFPYPSPTQRFYLIDTPISYLCKNNQLWRYDQYALQPVAASPPAGARFTLVSDDVTACTFTYQPGTATRAGVISLQLTLSANGETIQLLEQGNVPNGI
ncbi:MAG: prepilin-type N-terminal cleavage/methylation domain-containing protein [Pseudomonadales bacterium]|nr:prepilin-type N-terminal cleavage/methylation domain-containing protein [Pseudomonadales bacterium]